MALFQISLLIGKCWGGWYMRSRRSVCRQSQFSSEESNFGLYNPNNPLRYLFQEFTLRNPQALYINWEMKKSSILSTKMLVTIEKLTLCHFELEEDFGEISKVLGFFFELERFLRKKSTSLISPAKRRETGASFWFLKFAWRHAAVKFVAWLEERAV